MAEPTKVPNTFCNFGENHLTSQSLSFPPLYNGEKKSLASQGGCRIYMQQFENGLLTLGVLETCEGLLSLEQHSLTQYLLSTYYTLGLLFNTKVKSKDEFWEQNVF